MCLLSTFYNIYNLCYPNLSNPLKKRISSNPNCQFISLNYHSTFHVYYLLF